tara:strand:- start:619 stop:1050 length:432 start_codon:yes stop_codon:yes gene_type:complete
MTTFVISHNLQVNSPKVPAFDTQQLADELKNNSDLIISSEVIVHPHWILSVSSNEGPQILAEELVRVWLMLRQKLGHDSDHKVLALGGRKDSKAMAGAPLQEGFWGVDVVETIDKNSFLQAINWAALKSGRPSDAVFEVSSSD